MSAATAPAVEWGACPEQVPPEQAARVRCGVLTVPQDRSPGASSTRTLRLPVAVVPSRSPSPKPDPVVFPTGGGPGAGSLSRLWYFLDYAEWATAERDVVLLEQRGDRLARPALDCPELDVTHQVVGGRLAPARQREAAQRAATTACHDRLVRAGVDLAAYTSAATAGDLQDLRRALGYDEWNLYGVSYGSRVALTAMRDQPAGLRAVVLDGVFPPNGTQHHNAAGFASAVDALLTACAGDPACHAAYPDLGGSLERVLERARRAPIVAQVRAPGSDRPVRMEISDAEVMVGLQQALYDDNTVRALPFVIDQLARGNDAVAAPLAQHNVDLLDYYTEGLRWSVDCTEEKPFYDGRPEVSPDRWARRWAAAIPQQGCDWWPVTPLGTVEDQPVHSDIRPC